VAVRSDVAGLLTPAAVTAGTQRRTVPPPQEPAAVPAARPSLPNHGSAVDADLGTAAREHERVGR